jgi:hypothetical protein
MASEAACSEAAWLKNGMPQRGGSTLQLDQMLEVSLQHAERQNQNAELGLVLQCVVDPLGPKEQGGISNAKQKADSH